MEGNFLKNKKAERDELCTAIKENIVQLLNMSNELEQRDKDLADMYESGMTVGQKLDKIIDVTQVEKAKLELELKEKQESLKESRNKIEALVLELQESNKQLEEKEEMYQKASESMQQLQKRASGNEKELEEAGKEIQCLKEELEAVRNKNDQSDSLFKELEKEMDFYRTFRAWNDENAKVHLRVDDSGFKSFLSSLQMPNIAKIYEGASSIIQEEGLESSEILDGLIDCCVSFNSKKYGLSRQQVKSGETFDERLHKRTTCSNYNGIIEEVLLRGILQEGNVYQKCKSVVKILPD